MLDARAHRALEGLRLGLAAALVVACSGVAERGTSEMGAGSEASAVFFPQRLHVSAQAGSNGVFAVVALTLRQGSTGAELYVAVRNTGDVDACNPSFSVELREADQRVVAAGISGVNISHFYRLRDGSGTVAGCVPPGALGMIAITDLALDCPIEEVREVSYRSSYWFLDAAPIAGVRLSEVEAVARDSGIAYTGALANDLDVVLARPTVAVFPINAVGRPLGVAYGVSAQELPPGATWEFETNVSDAGSGYEAYPMGGP